MSRVKITRFSGLRPRLPESLLAEYEATIAQNCDLAYGELRATKDGYQVNGPALTNAPQALYTDDGLTFYTWAKDVDAVRSPIADDKKNRLYFTDGSGAMQVCSRILTKVTGGEPGTSFNVGVPRPSKAPVLSVNLPDVTDAAKYTLVLRFHYEANGTKYQETTLAVGNGTDAGTYKSLGNQKYQIAPPVMTRMIEATANENFPVSGEAGVVYKDLATGTLYTWSGTAYVTTTTGATPVGASAVLRLTATASADNAQFCDVYSSASSLASTTSTYQITLAKDAAGATYTATLNVSIPEADKETRAYVYTYVNSYGEEGPPSKPTLVTTSPLAYVDVTVELDAAVAGYVPVTEIRLYRTPTGSAIAEYFYSRNITNPGYGPQTVLDTTRAEMLNEPLASTYWTEPPAGLAGLMSLPNGILAAWKGNELWFSEAYKPWAWPSSYVKPLPHSIVGGIAHGAGAVITTVTQPYLVSGVSPDAMTTARINVDQAGVSKWSLAVVDGAVVYACNDGLMTITGGAASLGPGQRFFTRDVWRERYGSHLAGMRFLVWDGRLVVFHGSGSFTPFMIRFDEADGTMTELPNFAAAGGFVSAFSDQCYYALGNNLYQFNGGTAQTATWQSREGVLPTPTSFGVLQAVCTGAWTLTLNAALNPAVPAEKRTTSTFGGWTQTIDAATGLAVTLTTALPEGVTTLRIPSGFLSDRWKVKLVGTGRFRELRLAQTGRELAQV